MTDTGSGKRAAVHPSTSLFEVDGYRAVELSAVDVARLQAMFESNPEYFLAVNGRPALPTEADEEVHGQVPAGWSYTKKWVIGFVDASDALIAVANVVSDLLAVSVWHIGLYLVATRLHGTGVAHVLYRGLEAWTRREGASWLRLGVVAGNARAERFWSGLSFVELRERRDMEMGLRIQTVRVLAKSLAGGTLDDYLALVPRDRPFPASGRGRGGREPVPPEPIRRGADEPPAMSDLAASWQRAWHAIGSESAAMSPPASAALRDELVACYAEPHRSYHTLQHLRECIAGLDDVLSLAAWPGEVELALWFHDAIYDVRAHDNEERSADWARAAILGAGAPADVARRVHALVMATRHDALPATPDGRLVVDIDLSILGADAARFAEYEVQVRREYAWVADEVFRVRRRAVLQRLLERPSIYGTARFRGRMEQRARDNLQRSLHQLDG